MALKQVGVILTAQNGKAYVDALNKASKANDAFAQSAYTAAKPPPLPKMPKNGSDMSFMEKDVEALKAKFLDLRTALPLAAFDQFVGFMKGSVTAAANFEASLNRFGAVTGSNSAQLKEFNDLFLQMGKDTQYSAQQAADAAVNLAKGGLTPAMIAGGALADTLTLASAGELDLGAAAEITAKQLGVWNSQGVTSAQVADLLAQAANASTVDVDQLAVGLANVGGVAKNSGVTFKDTVQTMALISSGFSSASDAGTSYKTFLSNLIPTSDTAKKAFKQLNLLTAEGTSKFYDSKGAFIGMQQAAQLLTNATNGLSDAQKNQYLTQAFGSDAIRTAAKLAEAGAAGFLAMGESMKNAGSATDQAAKRQMGYNYANEQLNGSIETLQITIGQKLLPLFTDFKQGLTLITNGAIEAVKMLSQLVSMGDKFDELHQKILGGAQSWDDYNASLDKVDAQLPVWMGNMDRMTRQAYEFYQAQIQVGMSTQQAAAATEKASKVANDLDVAITTLQASSPAAASALDDMSTEIIKLTVAGGTWEKKASEIGATFQETGDVDAFKASITGLASEFDNAQKAVGIQGGGFGASIAQLQKGMNSTLNVSDGLTDAAMRYATGIQSAGDSTAGIVPQIQLSTEELEKLREKLLEIAQAGGEALGALNSSTLDFYDSMSKGAADHEKKMADIIKGGGGGGGNRVSATEKANKDIEKLTKATDEKLVELEKQKNADIVELDRQTVQKLADFDQKLVVEKQQAYDAMENIVKQSLADIIAAQEANDLDLVGADEKQRAGFMAREQAEAKARQSVLDAQAEAARIAAEGDAALAQQVYDTKMRYIQQQQALDEEYYRKRQELANDPAALAELDKQYNEATMAVQNAQNTQLGIVNAGNEQKKAAAASEREAIVAEAEKQKTDILAKAEEERARTVEAANKQKDEIIAAAREKDSEVTGSAGQSIEERLAAEQEAYKQEQLAQALAYADEQAKQKAHLGQMLIDWMQAKAKSDPIMAANLAKMTDAVAKEYGVQQTVSAQSFEQMTQDILDYVTNGGTNLDGLMKKLAENGNEAFTTEQKMRNMKTMMTEELVASFQARKLTVEQLTEALKGIPAKVSTLLEVDERVNRTYNEANIDAANQHGANIPPQRAVGGPVSANMPYVVGENRKPELFVPATSGKIVPMSGYSSPPAGAAQISSSYSRNSAISYNYSPTYAGSPPSPQYDFAMMELRSHL